MQHLSEEGECRMIHCSDIAWVFCLQAAFGSDLSCQTWSDESLGLKHTKGKGRLSYLIEHTLDVSETAMRNPLLKVNI